MVLIVGTERLHAGGATHTSGRVTDPPGLAIPNARVALVHRGDSGTRKTRTDEQGAFFFRAVPAGMYTITVQAGPFKTVSNTLETTAAGANIV
jgi:Carboxypeptidase regulatory-like domain